MERAAYRIIDANFNRAREALRVIEEFCRFALDCAQLTERTRRLRHELSSAIDQLDAGKLLSSRDTLGDVGIGQKTDRQIERAELKDCFTAGCKRLTEALRAIAEVTQTQDRPLAEKIEKLRYDTYTLEKDIVLFSEPAEKFKRVKLYIVITSHLPADILSLTDKCIAGAADCIQLRAKDINDDILLAVAEEFTKICKAANVLSIINDRVDIAIAASADGVHLGQNDLPTDRARSLQLAPLIIGRSTHSLDQLETACKDLPTYVSLGPVFATPTKPSAPPVGLEYVKLATEKLAGSGIAHVAIGGITPDNVDRVLAAGAKTIAVCSAVTNAPDPARACQTLKQKLSASLKTQP